MEMPATSGVIFFLKGCLGDGVGSVDLDYIAR